MKNSCLLLLMILCAVLPFASCKGPANADPGFTYEDWQVNTMPATLIDMLAWIRFNAVQGKTYTIVLKANETIPPQSISFEGMTGVTLILKGGGVARTIDLAGTGSLFTIKGGTLILDENITLRGNNSNNAALVTVEIGGVLKMRDSAKIEDNTGGSNGGGVFVNDGGTFTMSGGIISGNTGGSNGGGVYVNTNGTFTKNGGEISGNTASGNGHAVYWDRSSPKKRDTALMAGDSLSTSVSDPNWD
ncbi:hypothetical protein ACYULU_14390 [Breznakiellaceae bacterium SP9]